MERITTVLCSKFEKKLFNDFLKIETNDSENSVIEAGYKQDTTIYVMTTCFENGYFADIKLCAGQSNFFGDCVLFNENGYEQGAICFDDFNNNDIFEFEIENDIYKIIINVK